MIIRTITFNRRLYIGSSLLSTIVFLSFSIWPLYIILYNNTPNTHTFYIRDPCNSPTWVLDSPFSVGFLLWCRVNRVNSLRKFEGGGRSAKSSDCIAISSYDCIAIYESELFPFTIMRCSEWSRAMEGRFGFLRTNLYPELSVLTLSPISVNAYMPRILAKSVY